MCSLSSPSGARLSMCRRLSAGRTSTPTRPRARSAATSKWRRSTSSGPRSRRSSRASLKYELHSELHLPRVADALSQESVEVEQRDRGERIHIVRVVERVEHLHARNELVTPSQPERPLQPPV